MIFSLFIILGGTLVLAGWAQMLATRATYATMTEEAQKRRIAMANGRALARQYVLNQMPSASSFLGTNYSLANGWGGFDISVPPVNQWTNTNFTIGNPFNPISDSSFVAVTPGHISNSAETNTWTFLIRSRSPVLAGFPLVIQNPATTNLAWASSPQKIFWDDVLGLSNAPVIPFTSGTNSSSSNGYIGFFASPMNTNYAYTDATVTYPTKSLATNTAIFVPPAVTNNGTVTRNFTGGSVAASLVSTQAATILRYMVPDMITNIFSLTYLVTNMNIGTNVNITTNTAILTNVSSYTTNKKSGKVTTNYSYTTNYTYNTNTITVTNYATNTYVDRYTNSSATNVTITASTATNALHVIIPPSNTNTASITLSGTNNTRRVYINHAGRDLTIQTATFNENYAWWLGMTVAGSSYPFTVMAPTGTKSLTLQGGIRSERNINLNQGNLILNSNSVPAMSGTNVAPVEFVTDRILWLEEQRSP